MNSGELTRIQLANRLVCASQQISIGPTGPAGGTGPTGSPAPTIGLARSFTIFLDYSATNAISRVYIPPGLFANAPLSAGGTFTANQGTDLVFLGNPTIDIQNTTYPFIVGLFANGYTSTSGGRWELTSPSQIRPGAGYLNVTTTADYTATIGADLGAVNGGSLTPRPSSGIGAGFLGMITLFYM